MTLFKHLAMQFLDALDRHFFARLYFEKVASLATGGSNQAEDLAPDRVPRGFGVLINACPRNAQERSRNRRLPKKLDVLVNAYSRNIQTARHWFRKQRLLGSMTA